MQRAEDPASSFTINGNGKQVRDLLLVSERWPAICWKISNPRAAELPQFPTLLPRP